MRTQAEKMQEVIKVYKNLRIYGIPGKVELKSKCRERGISGEFVEETLETFMQKGYAYHPNRIKSKVVITDNASKWLETLVR